MGSLKKIAHKTTAVNASTAPITELNVLPINLIAYTSKKLLITVAINDNPMKFQNIGADVIGRKVPFAMLIITNTMVLKNNNQKVNVIDGKLQHEPLCTLT